MLSRSSALTVTQDNTFQFSRLQEVKFPSDATLQNSLTRKLRICAKKWLPMKDILTKFVSTLKRKSTVFTPSTMMTNQRRPLLGFPTKTWRPQMRRRSNNAARPCDADNSSRNKYVVEI